MQIGPLSSDQTIVALGGGVLVLAVVGWGLSAYRKSRPTPEQVERGRRAMLQTVGKLGDGSVFEVHGHTAIYSYEARGVKYTASQDLAALKDHLPPDLWVIIGPVSVKYDPRNPANSIVLSEGWTGLRTIS